MIQQLKSRRFWKKQLRDVLLIALIGLPWGVFMCRECNGNVRELMMSMSLSALLWVVTWKGNSALAGLANSWISWLQSPIKRLIIGVLGHTLYTIVLVLVVYQAMQYFFDIEVGNIKGTIYFSVAITLLITLVLSSREFLMSWRQLSIESERMKKEVISSKYESLKNQVNPHFLFNSLNALTNLIYEDQDQAAKFVKKLSDVYRYVLESRDKDLVPLGDEMKFVESYLFLQKIRYGESLRTVNRLQELNGFAILPLSVQMLIENAIKHNIISEEEPLEIETYMDSGYLWVINNLQKKNIIKRDSSEVGLSNIKARYAFFTETPVVISDSEGQFKVGLPLINKI